MQVTKWVCAAVLLLGPLTAAYALQQPATVQAAPATTVWDWLGLPFFSALTGDRTTGMGLLGLLAVTYYYLLVWAAVGNKRLRGKWTPRPTPPTDLSPAALRYVCRMAYDNAALTVALISMAVKGYLYIEEKERTLSVVRDEGPETALSPVEAQLARHLFKGRNKFSLSWSNRKSLADLKRTMRQALEARYRKDYFRRNTVWCLVGLILSTVVMLAVFLVHLTEWPTSDAVRRLLDLGLGLGLAVGAPTLLYRERTRTTGVIGRRTPLTLILAGLVCCLLGAAMTVEALRALYAEHFLGALFMLTGITIVNSVFLPRLPAYTRKGAAIFREAVGFKRHLIESGEAYFPNEDGPRIFEVFLPHAIALDEGDAWAAVLMDALGDAPRAEREETPYSPVWYAGNKWERLTPREFVAALTTALNAALSSTTAPASHEAGRRKTVPKRGESSRDPSTSWHDHSR